MAEWLSLARRTLSESKTKKINESFFHAERRGFFLPKIAGVLGVLKHLNTSFVYLYLSY
jgi:hypothetical protein